MSLDNLKMIDENDYVVWSYMENVDLWQVEAIGWCGGFNIKLCKDKKVTFVVNYKDIRPAHSSEIDAGKNIFC